jgi:hypothetical protein
VSRQLVGLGDEVRHTHTHIRIYVLENTHISCAMSWSSWTLFFFFTSRPLTSSFFLLRNASKLHFLLLTQSPSPSEKCCHESEPFLLCIRQMCVCVCVCFPLVHSTQTYIHI